MATVVSKTEGRPLCGHYKRLGKGTTMEVSLKAFPKKVSDGADTTFCGRDIMTQSWTWIGSIRQLDWIELGQQKTDPCKTL